MGAVDTDSVSTHRLEDDGRFPNNEELPVLLYRNAVQLPEEDPASGFEARFRSHGWRGQWRNGIYGFHHYHSTAHEVLGVARGSARVQLGGDDGIVAEVAGGDVIVIPAGVAHKSLECSDDFLVVGAYPDGQRWDMNYGEAGERPAVDRNIADVPLPDEDPVAGEDGPLATHWRPEPR